MFELLTATKAKITAVETLTSKKREDDTHPGLGFFLTILVPNHKLSAFDGYLKSFLYTKTAAAGESPRDKQKPLDGVQEATDMPHLSNIGQHVGELKWNQELVGYELVIAQGINDKGAIPLADCELSRFRFKPKQGGTTEMRFRVEAYNVDAKTNGKVQVLKDTEIEVTAKAAEVESA